MASLGATSEMVNVNAVTLKTALTAVVSGLDCITTIKKEQELALVEFLGGNDVFAVLPTGFGKSLIYQLAPLVLKNLDPSTNPIFIVVSPLIALMEDQVQEASKLGLTAMQIGVHNDRDIQRGHCQLVFGSPEAWLLNDKWRKMLDTPVYRQNLMGIVVDEVHITYKWGHGANGKPAFRESFSKLGELRSIAKQGTPVLALTASADMDSRERVCKLLHMENATRVTVSPNRSNIRLGLASPTQAEKLQCLDWIVDEVRAKAATMAPILIYCRSLKAVGQVFCYLKAELAEDAWVDRDPDHTANTQLIGIYHSKTHPHNKKRVISSLNAHGNCRVVVATTALGMGLNFPNISHVVMYGPPDDTEAIVQQVGRAGRNGLQSHAILYNTKQSIKIDKAVNEVLKTGQTSCFRKALYGQFEENAKNLEPGHFCCSFCHRACSCGGQGVCVEPMPSYEMKKAVCAPVKTREVGHDDKALIKSVLEDYNKELVKKTYLYTTQAACTGFSAELIDAVLKNCAEIFDLDYILNHLPVFSHQHARYILEVISEVFDDIPELPPTSRHDESDSQPEPDMYFLDYFDEKDEDSDTDL